jgi:hypothetical protein
MMSTTPRDRDAPAGSTRTRRPAGLLAALVLAGLSAVLLTGCGDSTALSQGTTPQGQLPRGAQTVRLDPADFTTRIDNPYLPMAPGSRWVYRDVEGGEVQRVVVSVTPQTKVIDGVTVRVVHDIERRGTETVEDTHDWFAQDRAGNVWYLGEATQEYKNGRPSSTKGSWQAGVAGAQAGIAMPAHPQPGMVYRQEYREGTAEDAAGVLSVREQVQAPQGHYTRAVLTKEFTPLEPRAVEYKLYAPGVGLVLAVGVSGDASRQELLRFKKGGG